MFTPTTPFNSALLCLLLCCTSFLTTNAQIIRVDAASTAISPDGNSWANAYANLQQAIDAASAGTQIWVKSGIYHPTMLPPNDHGASLTDRDKTFLLKTGVALYGGFAGAETNLTQRDFKHNATVLSGDLGSAGKCRHIVLSIFNDNTTRLDGFTIRDGYADISAGFYAYGQPIFPTQGGGVYMVQSSLVISNCLFTANSSFYEGGALKMEGGSGTVINCIFYNNTGYGAANVFWGSAVFTNCSFVSNAGGNGGGLGVAGSTVNLNNCIFDNNTASNGSCVYFSQGSHIAIVNSILWGNGANILGNDNSTINATYSIVQGGYPGIGNMDKDPLFVNAGNPAGADNIWGTADDGLQLSLGSPAVNVGCNAALPSGIGTDVMGAARIQNGMVDLGANETNYCRPDNTITYYVDNSVAASGNGLSWAGAFKELREAVFAAGYCNNLDTILVTSGTYKPTDDGNRDSAFTFLRGGVKLYGGYSTGGISRNIHLFLTILSGDIGVANDATDNSYHVMAVAGLGNTADSIVIDGFTIQQGNANGAGVKGYKGQQLFRSHGAGLLMKGDTSAKLAIRNCYFNDNHASGNWGAAVAIDTVNAATLDYCVFNGNSVTNGQGGALYNSFATSMLNNCLFTNNQAEGFAGAIQLNGTNVLTINNGTFYNNYSQVSGGALRAGPGSAATINNTIFYKNMAGAAPASNDLSLVGTVHLNNCLLQLAPANYAAPATLTHCLHGFDPKFLDEGNPAGADSKFGTADDGLALQAGSVAINWGDNSLTPASITKDLFGTIRIQQGIVDAGAYESAFSVLPLQWLSVNGKLNAQYQALLSWKVSENNVANYAIEKSSDGRNYASIATIASQGDGDHNYIYTAPEKLTGKGFYRIKQLDVNGLYTYSPIIILSSDNNMVTTVYPTVVHNGFTISTDQSQRAQLVDLQGRVVATYNISVGSNYIPVANLLHGVYVVKTTAGNAFKIIKQ